MHMWTFILTLRNWELEELLCVRSYLMERLCVFLNEFEENFMKAYLEDKPCIIWRLSGAQWLNWCHELFVEDYNYKGDEWIESCLGRGLKYLSAVFSADKLPKKFKALDFIDSNRHYLCVALNNARCQRRKEATAEIERPSVNSFYNDIEQPNEAWFWGSEANVSNYYRCMAIDTNDHQHWGYVIWDHARLERLGILTKSSSDMQAIIGTDWHVKRAPKRLEERTREQEEIWSREGLPSKLNEPRPVFDWKTIWFE